MKKKVDDKALDELSLINCKKKLDKNDLDKIIICSKSSDDEVRAYAAELLVNFNSESSKKALLKLATDTDSLVRVNACDSLCVFSDIEVLKFLLQIAVSDEDELVRAYAVLSTTDILLSLDEKLRNEGHKQLAKLLKSERSNKVRLAIFSGLYQLGEMTYLCRIFEYLQSDEYIIRCFTLNILDNICNKDNYKDIINAILKIQKNEESKSVLNKIESVLNNISKEFVMT